MNRKISARIALVCSLCLAGALAADSGNLNFTSFTSLPSAQGWTYESDGAPETSTFSVSNGVLVQNTLSGPWTFEWYRSPWGVVDPSMPFTLKVRARVLADSGVPSSAFGFCFGASTGTEAFLIGLSTDKIQDTHNVDLTTTANNTIFHDYKLDVTPGVGYKVYVDGALLATGLPRVFLDGLNRLILGDCTRGKGALAEVVSFSFTQVKEVKIDIKPGSDTNTINLGSAGVIPVAILSAADFDATTVNPETVSLAGASVKMVGKSSKYLCHPEDVNGDGLVDLVCQVYTAQFMMEEGSSIAVLEARTFSGQRIRGEDAIRVVL